MTTPAEPPTTSPPPRRCLRCGYVLEYLPEPRCPECGRTFDPADPRTFRRDGPRPFEWQLTLLVAVVDMLMLPVCWWLVHWMSAGTVLASLAPAAFAMVMTAGVAAAAVLMFPNLRTAILTTLPAGGLMVLAAYGAQATWSIIAAIVGLGIAISVGGTWKSK